MKAVEIHIRGRAMPQSLLRITAKKAMMMIMVAGSQAGASTHSQLHAITPASLNAMNSRVSASKKPRVRSSILFSFIQSSPWHWRGQRKVLPWSACASRLSVAGSISVSVGRPAVLIAGLSIVVLLAQRLPVGRVPKQRGIAAMRSDVVNDRRHPCTAFIQAHHAQRMLCKIFPAGTLPL